MKFKSKPIKVEQDSGCTSSGSDMDITEAGQRFSVVASSERGSLDIAEAMRSLSPLPRSSIAQQSLPIKQPLDDSLSDLEQNNNPSLTKLPSPSPIRSADEDSGVGGSPGSGTRVPLHNCTMCSKKFSRADILRKHMKTHVNTSCTVCGQIFNDKVALGKHQVEVHTLDRVFQCSQCEKGFKEMRTLRLHLKIHNAEYPEQCGVCQKVFRTKWQLKQHQMDHGGERPYPCPECSFTCKTKQQLNEHRRKHSGEKAYSCVQCGTRFTYRNGLIKHTKLNRCPKKIITPEGETIIKKRSRTFGNTNNKITKPPTSPTQNATSGSPLTSPLTAGLTGLTPGLTGLTSPVPQVPSLQRQMSTSTTLSESSMDQTPPTTHLPTSAAPNATLFVQNNQIQLHANGGTYGLALLEDGSLIATPQTALERTTPTSSTTTYDHQKSPNSPNFLSPNVMAALSAATGLSPQDINSWASNLPAGTTFKVTHHYDQSLAVSKAASTLMKQTSPSVSSPRGSIDHVFTRQQRQQLTLEMASSACHDSLVSACVGLPSYQESFAVDPNEILSKDRATRVMIKQEPPFMINSPDDLNNNTNRVNAIVSSQENCLSNMISDGSNYHNSSPQITTNCTNSSTTEQQDIKPSVLSMANSRLLNMEHTGFNANVNHYIKQEVITNDNNNRLVQNNNMSGILSDIDLDEFPDNIMDDMDISGFNLNDQDFTSIKSIVEQTFKDGRDVLDIISAV